MTLNRFLLLVLLLGCASGVSFPAFAAPSPIGEAAFTHGAVTAGPDGGVARFLAKGEPLYPGDIITTGPKSMVILHLEDGAAVTVRPDSVFSLEDYTIGGERPSAWMRLFRGGIRALSGLIAKKNPETGYTLQTPTAVCGIRGTEFDARICEGTACDEEARKAGVRGPAGPDRVVGRVVRLKGVLRAWDESATERTPVQGGPVYRGDTLETEPKGFAVLAFRDRSRLTLQGGSRFEVAQFDFEDAQKEDSVLLRLLHGGLRIFSGLAARKGPEAYRVKTPTAVCGVRGTGVDVFHGETEVGSASLPEGPGSYFYVWDGSVELAMEGGTFVLNAVGAAFWPAGADRPRRLPEVPAFMRENPAPRPDQEAVDWDALFVAEDWETYPPGLYVSVYGGHVSMENAAGVLHLGGGEAGHAGEGTLTRLQQQPPFQVNDPVPRPEALEQVEVSVLESILEEFGLSPEDRSFECVIQ